MSSSIFTCGAVPVLGILNQKNHQERDDAADGIHDKLPCIGKAEQWPTYQPDDDEAARQPNVHGRPVRRAVSEANLENQCSLVLRVKSPDPIAAQPWRSTLVQPGVAGFMVEGRDVPGHGYAMCRCTRTPQCFIPCPAS